MAGTLETKFWNASRFFLVASLSLGFVGCDAIMGCKNTEMVRVKSPDGKVDAVTVARDCGATTGVSKTVYLVPSGAKIETENAIFTCDHEENLEFKWEGAKVGLIEYSKARIFKFQNFWASKHLDNFQYEVQITEKKK